MSVNRIAWCVIVSLPLLAAPAWGQQLERDPRPVDELRPTPYLSSNLVDFRALLAGPPAVDSILDQIDRRAIEQFQTVSEARWHLAEADDRFVYPRFEEAFGR